MLANFGLRTLQWLSQTFLRLHGGLGLFHPTLSPPPFHPGSNFHHGRMAHPAFPGSFPIFFHTGNNKMLICFNSTWASASQKTQINTFLSFSHTSHPTSKPCLLTSIYNQDRSYKVRVQSHKTAPPPLQMPITSPRLSPVLLTHRL